MVTDGCFKYVYSEANATEELYDQAADPQELSNLAYDDRYADRLEEMRDLVAACAIEFQDMDLFDGEGLAVKQVDRKQFPTLPVTGMGWRWY
jgi:hypothetical protein